MTFGEFQAGSSKWHLHHPFDTLQRAVQKLVGNNREFAEHLCCNRLVDAVTLAQIAKRPLSDIAADLQRELQSPPIRGKTGASENE